VCEKKKNIADKLLKKLSTQNTYLNDKDSPTLEKEIQKQAQNIDLNKACLCFQALIEDEENKELIEICEPVYSTVVRNTRKRAFKGDLIIKCMAPCRGPAGGGTEAIILCDAVNEGFLTADQPLLFLTFTNFFISLDDIMIKFYESKSSEIGNCWEIYAPFNPKNVHKNVGIPFQVPPYRDALTIHSVPVFVVLFGPSDGMSSNILNYNYMPDI
jgi:hypothetical protein